VGSEIKLGVSKAKNQTMVVFGIPIFTSALLLLTGNIKLRLNGSIIHPTGVG
jgi:hypothetical protein